LQKYFWRAIAIPTINSPIKIRDQLKVLAKYSADKTTPLLANIKIAKPAIIFNILLIDF